MHREETRPRVSWVPRCVAYLDHSADQHSLRQRDEMAAYPRKRRVKSAPTKLCVIPVRTEIIPHYPSDWLLTEGDR